MSEPALKERPALGLEVFNMSKRFGSVAALESVSMRVRAGSVHALLGENGAGKSTLVKCVMGFHHPDEGGIMVDGREQEISNPRDAHGLGLGMVYQHFTLVPNMTVAENLFMARADVPAIVDWSKVRDELQAFLDRTPFQIPLDRPVRNLSAGEKQKTEILKQFYLHRRLVILDEPTSVLTPQEADQVLGLLRDMAHDGHLTVLLITHKLREVAAFCEDVTVLRRGRNVGDGPVADQSADQLARMMIGDQAMATPVARSDATPGKVVLRASGLVVHDDTAQPALSGVDLEIRAGEIVGIAGVSGNGQSELIEVLAGQRERTSGTIEVHGAPYRATRGEMAAHKLFCLPEEPLRNAVVPRMSVAENMTFRRFDHAPYAKGGWWLDPKAMRREAAAMIDRYRIKASSPDAPISHLSGGNVQRAVLARELSGDVELLIVANPCFGLDIAAVSEIRAQIVAARNRGAAVLLVSEDLDEILELSDRICVMFNGRLVFETTAAAADLAVIGRHMAGH